MADDSEGPRQEAVGPAAPHEVTRLLELWSSGRVNAFEELFPLVYEQLRALADAFMRRERAGHTMQPTELVHEAYFRLTGRRHASIHDRAHFFAVAAQAMRRILVDHARRTRAEKRPDPAKREPLEAASPDVAAADVDVLALHEALDRLAEVNPRQGRVVELRYFGGMTTEETAALLAVSTATVERDWRAARLWLHRRLARGPSSER